MRIFKYLSLLSFFFLDALMAQVSLRRDGSPRMSVALVDVVALHQRVAVSRSALMWLVITIVIASAAWRCEATKSKYCLCIGRLLQPHRHSAVRTSLGCYVHICGLLSRHPWVAASTSAR